MINIAMDATVLSNLMSCPRLCNYRFNHQYVSAGGKSNSLECGSLAHIILEFYNKALIRGAMRSVALGEGYAAGREYVVPYADTNRYVKDVDHKGMVNTPEESQTIERRKLIGWKYVFETMEEYFDYYASDNHTVIAAEEVRQEVIYQDDELRVLWKAKYDNISDYNNGLIPKDYKTMQQNRPTMSLNNQFMGQCFLVRSRNIIIDKIGFQTSLPPREKFVRATISYSADRLAEWVNDIIPYYARMLHAYNEASHFPPNFTHCENKYGTCDFKEICEGDRSMRDEMLSINFIKGKKWDPSNE